MGGEKFTFESIVNFMKFMKYFKTPFLTVSFFFYFTSVTQVTALEK